MVSAFARGVLLTFDLLVIGVILGPADAGQYSAASRPILFVITGIGLFFFSFVASYSALQGREAAALLRTSVRSTAVASTGVAVVLALLSAPLVDLLYGDRYGDAAVVLAILALRIPLSAVSSPFNGVLLASGRQLLLMRNNLIAAFVSMALVLAAAPVAGIAGVAAASALAMGLVLVLNVRTCLAVGAVPSLRDTIRSDRTARESP
jgi:O-antigen/teichoic acid export membrane protein